ncbi:MAG: MerR family transcriptional regulator [Desulfuromonadaceae bacterium]|jgi:DNA-binding transcriptional MerR regulator|nr:MerR family transcriptional regulator [Desulfuromonas sp.]MDY0185985.1 MerR family transcriptional regulator [Desulfuromonadaceae bacterium]
MALGKTWYEVEAAAQRFGIKPSKLLFWVEEGLVRCEREGKEIKSVNIDDVRLLVNDTQRPESD